MKAARISADDEEAVGLAIDTVATSKDEKLANQLIDFLLGADGIPKVIKTFEIIFLYVKF